MTGRHATMQKFATPANMHNAGPHGQQNVNLPISSSGSLQNQHSQSATIRKQISHFNASSQQLLQSQIINNKQHGQPKLNRTETEIKIGHATPKNHQEEINIDDPIMIPEQQPLSGQGSISYYNNPQSQRSLRRSSHQYEVNSERGHNPTMVGGSVLAQKTRQSGVIPKASQQNNQKQLGGGLHIQRNIFSMPKQDEEQSAGIMNFSHSNDHDNVSLVELRRQNKHCRRRSRSKGEDLVDQAMNPSYNEFNDDQIGPSHSVQLVGNNNDVNDDVEVFSMFQINTMNENNLSIKSQGISHARDHNPTPVATRPRNDFGSYQPSISHRQSNESVSSAFNTMKKPSRQQKHSFYSKRSRRNENVVNPSGRTVIEHLSPLYPQISKHSRARKMFGMNGVESYSLGTNNI